MPERHKCYEKVRRAVDILGGAGAPSQRLEDAIGMLTPTQIDDYPTEELKRRFTEVTWALAKEEVPITQDGHARIAAKIVDLFEGICRLNSAR